MNEKIQCEFGAILHRGNISRHRKGRNHLKKMGDQETIRKLTKIRPK